MPHKAKDLQEASRSSSVWGVTALWLTRLGCAGAFGVLIVIEWIRWPNGSPLLGPLGIIWYNGIDFESVALCAISLAMLFAFLLKPHAVTGLISLLGGVNWLFWGVIALGIGC